MLLDDKEALDPQGPGTGHLSLAAAKSDVGWQDRAATPSGYSEAQGASGLGRSSKVPRDEGGAPAPAGFGLGGTLPPTSARSGVSSTCPDQTLGGTRNACSPRRVPWASSLLRSSNPLRPNRAPLSCERHQRRGRCCSQMFPSRGIKFPPLGTQGLRACFPLGPVPSLLLGSL